MLYLFNRKIIKFVPKLNIIIMYLEDPLLKAKKTSERDFNFRFIEIFLKKNFEKKEFVEQVKFLAIAEKKDDFYRRLISIILDLFSQNFDKINFLTLNGSKEDNLPVSCQLKKENFDIIFDVYHFELPIFEIKRERIFKAYSCLKKLGIFILKINIANIDKDFEKTKDLLKSYFVSLKKYFRLIYFEKNYSNNIFQEALFILRKV